jgi:hypothetical protein
MIVLRMWGRERGQIALEFIIVYSIVLVIFVLVFTVISGQRATILNAQQGSIARIEAQEIAGYIDHAISAGSGYSTTLTLAQAPGAIPYNIYVSTSGVVIINSSSGGQPVSAYAFSDGRNMSINGSLQYTGNGIGLYLIPAYTGTIKVSNIAGTVYIDRGSISNAGLLGSSILSSVQEGYGPVLSGGNGYFKTGTSKFPVGANSVSGFAWVYITAAGTTRVILDYGVRANAEETDLYFQGASGDLSFYNGATGYPVLPVSVNAWHFVGFTYGGGTSMTLYVDGSSSTITGVAQQAVVMTPSAYIGDVNPGSGAQYWMGSIANVQLYNASLTANQVSALYQEGIFGAPILQSNIVGWWPLDGNGNDYSGSGNNGQYSNLTFQTMAQFNVTLLAKNGTGLSGAPVGAVISKGLAGGSPGVSSGKTTNSLFSPVLEYNTINPNATVYAFGGNLSTANSLVGWWPLTFGEMGAGNIIYDLSSTDNAFGFNDVGGTPVNTPVQWAPLKLSRHLSVASFPGNGIQNAFTNFGAITINAVGSLTNITSRNNFTLVAWVKPKGTLGGINCTGIFGSGGMTGTGFQLNAKSTGNQCGIVYVGTANQVGNYITPFNALNWTMVSMTWSGLANLVSVYENSNVTYSNTVVGSTGIAPTNGQYYIGAQNSIGLNSFNGLISNVQLYSKALNAQQISQLSSAGPTGIPVLGAGLVGWWPLTGNAVDYSGGNAGTTVYNAVFATANYTFNNNPLPTAKVATFNGLGGVKVLTGGAIPFTGAFSTSLWFNSFNSPTTTFAYALVDAQLPNGNAYNVSLCGGGAASSCGLTGIHGAVGTGAAELSTSVNYPFAFIPYRPYNLVETFNTFGTWTIYLNGVNVSSGYTTNSASAKIAGSSDYLLVGGGTAASSYFYGQIADLQVYNSVLTPAQARQIYQQGMTQQSSVTLSGG